MKTEEIKHLIEPILTEHHLFLVELKISKDNVIEVFVDALEGVNIPVSYTHLTLPTKA